MRYCTIPQTYQSHWWKLFEALLLDDNGPEHALTLIADIECRHSAYPDIHISYNTLSDVIRERYETLMDTYKTRNRSYRANSMKTIDELKILHHNLMRMRLNRQLA